MLYINFIKHCTSNIPFHIFLIIHPVNQSGLYLNCCLIRFHKLSVFDHTITRANRWYPDGLALLELTRSMSMSFIRFIQQSVSPRGTSFTPLYVHIWNHVWSYMVKSNRKDHTKTSLQILIVSCYPGLRYDLLIFFSPCQIRENKFAINTPFFVIASCYYFTNMLVVSSFAHSARLIGKFFF